MAQEGSGDRFSHEIELPGGKQILIRRMTRDDRAGILSFANSLPEEDVLFLRIDITQPEVVDEWVGNLEKGLTSSLLAFEDKRVVGYASVHRDPVPWTRRVGEIRINIAPEYRETGLGRNMIADIFDLARGLGLKKLIASMTTEQMGARAGFRRIGFVPEAVLGDFVEDRHGKPHDLMIMSYDVDGLTDQVESRLHV